MPRIKKEKTTKEGLTDTLGKFQALQALSISEGGIILQKAVIKDIIRDIEVLSNNYKTLTMQEFISIGATLKSNLTMFNTLKNATENRNGAKEELEKYLEEEIKEAQTQ